MEIDVCVRGVQLQAMRMRSSSMVFVCLSEPLMKKMSSANLRLEEVRATVRGCLCSTFQVVVFMVC